MPGRRSVHAIRRRRIHQLCITKSVTISALGMRKPFNSRRVIEARSTVRAGVPESDHFCRLLCQWLKEPIRGRPNASAAREHTPLRQWHAVAMCARWLNSNLLGQFGCLFIAENRVSNTKPRTISSYPIVQWSPWTIEFARWHNPFILILLT
jgi:hypothetical protein